MCCCEAGKSVSCVVLPGNWMLCGVGLGLHNVGSAGGLLHSSASQHKRIFWLDIFCLLCMNITICKVHQFSVRINDGLHLSLLA